LALNQYQRKTFNAFFQPHDGVAGRQRRRVVLALEATVAAQFPLFIC
jgi:hypothetical protein